MEDNVRADLARSIKALCPPRQPEPGNSVPQLKLLKGVKVVLFDIYGTLFTSGLGDVGAGSRAQAAAAYEALRQAGFRPVDELAGARAAELLEKSIQLDHERAKSSGTLFPEVDIREIWSRVLLALADERLLDPGSSPGFAAERVELLAIEYECRINPAWPMSGCVELLHGLRDIGLTLGIVSNAQFYTPLIFKVLAPQEWELFEKELVTLSFQLREAKPSVRLVQAALDQLKLSCSARPDEALFVGNDMLNDIVCAAEAGCQTALFAGDVGSLRLRADDPRCARARPDVTVTHLPQLLNCIEPSA